MIGSCPVCRAEGLPEQGHAFEIETNHELQHGATGEVTGVSQGIPTARFLCGASHQVNVVGSQSVRWLHQQVMNGARYEREPNEPEPED